MKKALIYSLLALVIVSCEEVIDVDVPVAPPRLVIEASIDWEKGTSGNDQTVILSRSTPYFDNPEDIDYVTGADVRITNDDTNQVFTFTDQNDGTYTTSSFIPVLDQSYTLEVIYNGEVYTAQETMTSVVPIKDVYQSVEDGFDDEAIEINVVFDDPKDIENFYLFSFHRTTDKLADLFDFSDEFVDGNEVRVFYEKVNEDDDDDDELKPGDQVDIEMYGISERYHDYMRLLISQLEPDGPFGAVPVTLKGNCINQTNEDNYAFGYFRLTEVDRETYIIQ